MTKAIVPATEGDLSFWLIFDLEETIVDVRKYSAQIMGALPDLNFAMSCFYTTFYAYDTVPDELKALYLELQKACVISAESAAAFEAHDISLIGTDTEYLCIFRDGAFFFEGMGEYVHLDTQAMDISMLENLLQEAAHANAGGEYTHGN
jgi:hypothetical protein